MSKQQSFWRKSAGTHYEHPWWSRGDFAVFWIENVRYEGTERLHTGYVLRDDRFPYRNPRRIIHFFEKDLPIDEILRIAEVLAKMEA